MLAYVQQFVSAHDTNQLSTKGHVNVPFGRSSRVSVRKPARSLLWPYSSTFLAEHEVCREGFFHCGAVELAQKLLGQYLYCHESEVVVRILETEAYPEDDIAYTKLFKNNAAPELNAKFNLTGGIMVAWQPVYSLRSKTHLYITAGNEDSGDVVYLRSCEPIEGRHIIEERRQMSDETPRNTKKVVLVGPSKLSEGLGNEWENNPVLYEHGGVQLFHGIVPSTEKVLCGKRHLRSRISEVSDESYRFALETHMPSYQYTNKSTLRPLHQ